MYYINYFFIFSIFGHLLESILNSSSGFLYGWWTPVYGIGTIIIIFIHNKLDKYFNKNITNKFYKLIILFFSCSIILSIIEAIGGYLLKLIFNIELWDYTNFYFNIGKYTALEMSLIWGISSAILIYIIKPLLDKIIFKIPKIITYILIILFVTDCILTFLQKKA